MSQITAEELGNLTLAVARRLTGRLRRYLLIDLGAVNVPEVQNCTAQLLMSPFGDQWLVGLYLCRPDRTSAGEVRGVDPCLSVALRAVVDRVAPHIAGAFGADALDRWKVVTDALAVRGRHITGDDEKEEPAP